MDWGSFAAPAATVLVAAIGGIFAILANRGKTKVDFQQAINSGFSTLITEHRKDTDALRSLVKELRQTNDTQADLIETLEGERRRLVVRVLALEGQLKRAGALPLPQSDIVDI